MVDTGEAYDTDAVKRPRSTDGPKPDDTVESESERDRLDSEETVKEFVAKKIAVDSSLCVRPSIDMTNDAIVWSVKCLVAGLGKGLTRGLNSLLDGWCIR